MKHGNELDFVEEKALKNFIDSFTTVSLCEAEVGKEVAALAKEVNEHHHTMTCRKHGSHCRFNYPKFPIWTTIISIPYPHPPIEFEEERRVNLNYYKNTLSKVQATLEDEDIIKSIMDKYDKSAESEEQYKKNRKKRILELLEKAKVSENDYVTALSYTNSGYSYHLKRDVDEIFINSYNPEWLRAWRANLEIQFN